MARAGRKKKARPVTLPGMGGVRFVETEVQSPYDPLRRERVKRAIRGHTIDAIAQAGHLRKSEGRRDATDARLEAARKYLATYLAAEGVGVSAIDYGSLKVDTSFRYDGTPEAQARAWRQRAAIYRRIGPRLELILHRTIVEETPVSMQIRHLRSRLSLKYAAFYQDLRDALDGVSDTFGVATGRDIHRRAVSRETIS